MKAIYCEAYGTPQELVTREVQLPKPEAGQLAIALRARAVSYVDVLKIAGTYQVKSTPPFIPGGEAAGEVVDIGDGVEGFELGDRVLCGGGFAEQAVQDAAKVIRLPKTVAFEAAAAFRSNYTTAYYGFQRGRLQPGETVLVLGAAGGVGLAAIDLGKLMGARVIACASSSEKLAACAQLGADELIDYSEGFYERVRELTGGRGADVIIDPVGGDVFDEAMRCVAPFGRLLIIGFTGGRPALAKTNHLLIKDAEAIGFTIGALQRHSPEWAAKNLRVLIDWLASERIRPFYSHTLPLERAVDALELVQARQAMGKVLLV